MNCAVDIPVHRLRRVLHVQPEVERVCLHSLRAGSGARTNIDSRARVRRLHDDVSREEHLRDAMKNQGVVAHFLSGFRALTTRRVGKDDANDVPSMCAAQQSVIDVLAGMNRGLALSHELRAQSLRVF